jgi:hypothetical protein
MLTWLAFYFAFRSKRENMWQHCAIVGMIAAIITAWWDWNTFHNPPLTHPEYAAVANNSSLMATMLLLDFIWVLSGYFAICWFGWICRWLFIWRKQKEHPPMTPLARSLWQFGNLGWKLVVIIATPILLLIIGAAIYIYVIPPVLVRAASVPHYQTFQTVPTASPYQRGFATADSPTATPPQVQRALPVDTPPQVKRALPVLSPTPTPHRKHHPT